MLYKLRSASYLGNDKSRYSKCLGAPPALETPKGSGIRPLAFSGTHFPVGLRVCEVCGLEPGTLKTKSPTDNDGITSSTQETRFPASRLGVRFDRFSSISRACRYRGHLR